jgi:hypothetical protein
MSYREGYGTLKLSEPTTLRDIALTLSYIPSDFKTSALEELRKLLKDYNVTPGLRVECAWSTFIPKEEEYRKPDTATWKRILLLNLGDASLDYAAVNPELSRRLKKIRDDLDKEVWDFEALNKQITKLRYRDWKAKYAWDLNEEELKQVEHPFKGLILGNPNNPGEQSSNPNSLHDELTKLRLAAMQRLKIKEYRRKITPEEYVVLRSLSQKLPPAIQEQIQRDIKIYLFYDALAMWLDPELGLASYYPREFVEIGKRFLGEGAKAEAEERKPERGLILVPPVRELGVSGHIANYDVFIKGDDITIIEAKPGGKFYKRTVKGVGEFIKKAGRNLRLGWAQFPDFEVIYIYNVAEDNFGYAVNLQAPELSEWGYAPFKSKSTEMTKQESEGGSEYRKISQADFQKLLYEELEKARRSPAWQKKLRVRFEQIRNKVDWKRAIPAMTFYNYPNALEVAAAIALHHGGVEYELIPPNEIRVWSKGYYSYTGGG